MAPTMESLGFQDFLPTMAFQLGPDGLIRELCKGFELLMDTKKGLITLDSLRKNAPRLGLGMERQLCEDELVEMVREGDLDGDGALDQTEFCILMVRMSPQLMEVSSRLLGFFGM